MLFKDPNVDQYYVAYLKNDAAKEPIVVGLSISTLLTDAVAKSGRPKSDFEVIEIPQDRYERLVRFLKQ